MMATSSGSVKWFDKTKGFGFLLNDTTGEDVFVHQNNIKMDGFRNLIEGQNVTFDIKTEGSKTFAIDVVPEDMDFNHDN